MRFSPASALPVLIAGILAASGVQAQPTDLTSYVLFADKEFHANGLTVTGGNLGVNNGLLSSAKPLTAASSTVAAKSVRFDSRSVCAALFANDLHRMAPGCSPAQPFLSPILDLREACGFPDPFPSCNPSAAVLVLPGGTRTLPAGTYGNVRVRNGGVLTLSGGDYVFCRLQLSRNAELLALAPTRIMIAGDLVVSNATRLVPQSAGTPCTLEIFATGDKVGIQSNADVRAQLCAPNAELHVNHRAKIVGTFAAETINAHRITAKVATAVECPGQTTTTTTVTTTTTTTVPGQCGNEIVESGEDCDPPGGLTCPDSTGGAFVECGGDCTCPFGPPVTTTTTTPASTTSTAPPTTTTTTTLPAQCGNEIVESGEDCDPPGGLTCPDSTGGAFVECGGDCTCPFGPPVTTTTTTPASTTSTAPPTTTTTTTLPAQCGNEIVESGEDCDPPGGLTCPDSTGGAFVECGGDCTCPFGPPVTTTTTTTLPPQCGNEIVESGEDCDPPGGLTCPGSAGGAFVECGEDCTCPFGPATTTTTTPASTTSTAPPTTTTTLGPGSTTTTVTNGSTTTTTLQPAELCGNCVDDDRNNLTDFEDPACCAETQRFAMSITKGRIRAAGSGSRLRIRSGLASGGFDADPLTQDVFLQIRPEGGTDILCARVPAMKFMRMDGAIKFWDQKHTVESAQGIDDMAIKVRRNGSVRFRAFGRRVRFTAPAPGNLQVTVAFFDQAAGDTANRCSTTTQPFRTGQGNQLITP